MDALKALEALESLEALDSDVPCTRLHLPLHERTIVFGIFLACLGGCGLCPVTSRNGCSELAVVACCSLLFGMCTTGS